MRLTPRVSSGAWSVITAQQRQTAQQQQQAGQAAAAAVTALAGPAATALAGVAGAAVSATALASLVRLWRGGSEADALAAMTERHIGALIQDALEPQLRQIWADGWRVGLGLAQELAGSDAEPALDAATLAQEWAGRIADSYVARMAALLVNGGSAADLAAVLSDPVAADRIVLTEMGRALNMAAAAVYDAAGVTRVAWMTTSTNPEAVCEGNEAAGAVPLGSRFPGGVAHPPQHPNCQCVLVPA